MKKVFYLSTCDTCKRIIKQVGLSETEMVFQDIKKEHISGTDLEQLRAHVNSYEELFNKRSRKYASEGLKEKQFSDAAWKELILGEYTFLKRPIVILDNQVFIGNAKKTVEALKTAVGHDE
mgnify:CR=1 FL=1